jgi:hypothetical protein
VKRRQKTAVRGGRFRPPSHRTVTRPPRCFNLFSSLRAKRPVELSSQSSFPHLFLRTFFFATPPFPSPLPKKAYFGSTTSVLKMDSSQAMCGSWLAAYIGRLPQAPSLSPRQTWTSSPSSSANFKPLAMDQPSRQSRHSSPQLHWTVPVAREETLAVREKFRKMGWRPPIHKPSTSKVVARAKSLWDRYMTTSFILTHLGYKSLMGCC